MRYLPILCIFLVIGNLSLAQTHENERSRNHILKISPFHFLEGTLLLKYEVIICENRLGLQVSPGINYRPGKKGTGILEGKETPESGFQIGLQAHGYLIKPQIHSIENSGTWWFNGLYLGSFFLHRYRERHFRKFDVIDGFEVDDFQRVSEFSFGGTLGAQMALLNRVYFDLNIGLGTKKSMGGFSFPRKVTMFHPGYEGFFFRAGFQVGWGMFLGKKH